MQQLVQHGPREVVDRLISFLNAGKQSVVGTAEDPHVASLIAEADLIIEAYGLQSDTGECLDVARLRETHPSLVVLSITPYGLAGPWANRRATEFTLQAESGSIGMRGLMGQQPFQAGGRISDFRGTDAFLDSGNLVAGTPKVYAALSKLLAPHTRDIR